MNDPVAIVQSLVSAPVIPRATPLAAPRPALSIVVPVYRGAATVGRLVESLSDLKPPGGLEIVLVNDGSSDDSGDICRSLLQDARVPLVYIKLGEYVGRTFLSANGKPQGTARSVPRGGSAEPA